jgi:hypothetical protein
MSPRWSKPTDPARRLAQRDAPAALAVLREILKNNSTSNKDRIAAAKALLEFGGAVAPAISSSTGKDETGWDKIPADDLRIVYDILTKAERTPHS